jgi:hypothetical protein
MGMKFDLVEAWRLRKRFFRQSRPMLLDGDPLIA